MIGVADELKKLAELQEQGVLSTQEFEDQKERLLREYPGASVHESADEAMASDASEETTLGGAPFQRWGFVLVALCFVVGITVGRHWEASMESGNDPATEWLAKHMSTSAQSASDSTPAPQAVQPTPAPQAVQPTPLPAAPVPTPALPPKVAPRPPVVAPPKAPIPAPSITPSAVPKPAKPDQVWRVTVRDEDAQLGPKDAPATVVLFSNFENATSKAFAPNVRRLVKEFGKKVRVVFKHKVIPGSPGAIQASEAALAAGEQGKFWEFHDRLSVSTGSLSQATFEAIGQEVGLNTKRFQKALTSGRFRAQVLQDSLLANGLGAHSMPNILVNGVRTRGEKSYDVMKALVEEQLANRPKGRSYDEIVAAGKGFEQLGPSVGGFDTQGSATLGKAGARVQVVVFEDFQ